MTTSDVTIPVRLTNIVKRYGRRTVLDGVSIDVTPGVTGLVGPNGAGKSTLVRSILGLVRLASGQARVFGNDPYRKPRRVRQIVGVVPEDECTIPGLSGVEMVRYAAVCQVCQALRRFGDPTKCWIGVMLAKSVIGRLKHSRSAPDKKSLLQQLSFMIPTW